MTRQPTNSATKLERKSTIQAKVQKFAQSFRRCLVVGVDNVSSQQLHAIRRAIQGKAVLCMGKNSVVLRAIRGLDPSHPFHAVEPLLHGNVGLVFFDGEFYDIISLMQGITRASSAKVGTIAPCGFTLPAGRTDLDPHCTSGFATMGIATKITKGKVDVLSSTNIISAGERVSASAASLLHLLGIKPFKFGVKVLMAYEDGHCFPVEHVCPEPADLLASFTAALGNVAAMAAGLGFSTPAPVCTYPAESDDGDDDDDVVFSLFDDAPEGTASSSSEESWAGDMSLFD